MASSLDHQIGPDQRFSLARIWIFESLREIIKNFASESQIGTGSFGTVSRVTLQDGSCMAVEKICVDNDHLGREKFASPRRLKHHNILRLTGYGCDLFEATKRLFMPINNFGSPCDVEFPVTASAKWGIYKKNGSLIVHVPKYLSVHHSLSQTVLFARGKFDEMFSCLKSMVPKSIFDMAKRSHHSDPDSSRAEHGIKEGKSNISAAWVVTTAAPHHATGNRDLLSGFITEHDDQFVHALDGVPMQVRARGALVTDAVVLPDVWFVPGLTANIVSVSQLAELAYSVGFGDSECCIRSAVDGKTVGNAHLQESGSGDYVLDFLKIPLAI